MINAFLFVEKGYVSISGNINPDRAFFFDDTLKQFLKIYGYHLSHSNALKQVAYSTSSSPNLDRSDDTIDVENLIVLLIDVKDLNFLRKIY